MVRGAGHCPGCWTRSGSRRLWARAAGDTAELAVARAHAAVAACRVVLAVPAVPSSGVTGAR
ncbi:hypothetical protein [Actinoplanes sp. N902-109]|uniref:hypothetical protein n=1 Tax=Actinoplanes sp. (strain N902-109) TaxID=649831 RepID=UPI0003295FFE|nr:hypothetical protein [Actinoplanes sp. N902-109]AGL18979.1 hypothetical protein L083_5469 [Actinoplanes sp. N902-109]